MFLSRGFEKFFSPTIAFFSTDGLHHSWAVITHLISPLDNYNYNDFYGEERLKDILNKHKNDDEINPHMLVPNYLKKTEAEEKLNG